MINTTPFSSAAFFSGFFILFIFVLACLLLLIVVPLYLLHYPINMHVTATWNHCTGNHVVFLLFKQCARSLCICNKVVIIVMGAKRSSKPSCYLWFVDVLFVVHNFNIVRYLIIYICRCWLHGAINFSIFVVNEREWTISSPFIIFNRGENYRPLTNKIF